jgi:hypothetical protein
MQMQSDWVKVVYTAKCRYIHTYITACIYAHTDYFMLEMPSCHANLLYTLYIYICFMCSLITMQKSKTRLSPTSMHPSTPLQVMQHAITDRLLRLMGLASCYLEIRKRSKYKAPAFSSLSERKSHSKGKRVLPITEMSEETFPDYYNHVRKC